MSELQVITSCMPIYPIYRESLFPYWNEWLLFIWLSGLLLGELISPQDRTGLGAIKIVIILVNIVSSCRIRSVKSRQLSNFAANVTDKLFECQNCRYLVLILFHETKVSGMFCLI
jgi:hypothetical protein